jgi:hypothetical protein
MSRNSPDGIDSATRVATNLHFTLFLVVHALAIQQVFPVLHQSLQHLYGFYRSLKSADELNVWVNPTVLITEAPIIDRFCFSAILIFLWIAYVFAVIALDRVSYHSYALLELAFDVAYSFLVYIAAKAVETYDYGSLEGQRMTWILAMIAVLAFSARILLGLYVLEVEDDEDVDRLVLNTADVVRALLRYLHVLVALCCLLYVGLRYDKNSISIDGTITPFQTAIVIYILLAVCIQRAFFPLLLAKDRSTVIKFLMRWPIAQETRGMNLFLALAAGLLLASISFQSELVVAYFPVRSGVPLGLIALAPVILFVVSRGVDIVRNKTIATYRYQSRDDFDNHIRFGMAMYARALDVFYGTRVSWFVRITEERKGGAEQDVWVRFDTVRFRLDGARFENGLRPIRSAIAAKCRHLNDLDAAPSGRFHFTLDGVLRSSVPSGILEGERVMTLDSDWLDASRFSVLYSSCSGVEQGLRFGIEIAVITQRASAQTLEAGPSMRALQRVFDKLEEQVRVQISLGLPPPGSQVQPALGAAKLGPN